MNSIVKINSNEGGQFNAQNNRVSFSLPSDRYYDLSKAYLNLVMSCDVTNDPSPTVGKGVYVPVIRFANSAGTAENYSYENSALIRTAKLDCELTSRKFKEQIFSPRISTPIVNQVICRLVNITKN